jgi:hypothetical protein
MNRSWLLHGSPDPLPERVPLRAGPLSLAFEAGDLRSVKWGEREILRRVYAAVRDPHWNTVPGRLVDLHLRTEPDSFRIAYASEHNRREIDFRWRATLTGTADGTIRFEFDGEARSTFLRNRIGLCVLHPLRECAGARVRVHHPDGTVVELRFPEGVAAEQPVGGFTRLTGLDHEIVPGRWAELRFAGDLFETEDQRNWIDASFKTFSTPLHLPIPVEVPAGTRIRQTVELRLRSDRPDLRWTDPIRVEVPESRGGLEIRIDGTGEDRPFLPLLGLGAASHGKPLHAAEVDLLTRLQVSHLRRELRLSDPAWRLALATAVRDTQELGSALELAVHLPAQAPPDLGSVRQELARSKTDLVRIAVFRDGARTTRLEDFLAARAAFSDFGVPLGAGTAADLYQLHSDPLPPDLDPDFVCWSMNPQVHATDRTSIAETPEGAAQQVHAVRRLWPDRSLVVSPVTLRPRFNPVATAPEPPPAPGDLPASADPRQMSLFGAAWTLAMIAALAESQVEAVTFYETTGWLGVLAGDTGSSLPGLFPAPPGSVFPLYHVFADLAEIPNPRVVPLALPPPTPAAVLLLESPRQRVLLVANPGPDRLRLAFPDLPGRWLGRSLDATNVEAATRDALEFRRAPSRPIASDPGAPTGLTLDLAAFAYLRVVGPKP